jgi:hypothetical protein
MLFPTLSSNDLGFFSQITVIINRWLITVIWQTQFLQRVFILSIIWINLMLRFFSSLQRIEQHIASLNHHHTTVCPVCHQTQQWVSHGYLYKTSTQQHVGKRILCSRRYGKSGCGHSQSLYLACVIPQRRYPLSVLLAFVWALINGQTVECAYFHAIRHTHSSSRQAWRRLNGLWTSMG